MHCVITLNIVNCSHGRSLCAQKQNPATPVNVLRDIFTWKAEGATEIDIITRLRQRTVPAGYAYHTQIPGIV